MVAYIHWIEEEDKILRELSLMNVTFDEVCKVFPHRTKEAVRARCKKIGIDSICEKRIEIDFGELEALRRLRKV